MNFDEIVNDLCREFRRIRDEMADMAEDQFNELVKKELDKFWARQSILLQLFRKQIMSWVYKQIKKIL